MNLRARDLVRLLVIVPAAVGVASGDADRPSPGEAAEPARVVAPDRVSGMEPSLTRRPDGHVVVDTPGAPSERVRVTDLTGRDISDEVGLREEPGRITLDAAGRRAIVVKGQEIETVRARSDERLILPDGLFVLTDEPPPPEHGDESGRDEAAPEPPAAREGMAGTWLRLTLRPSPLPAVWRQEEGSYFTELTFGVHPSDGRPGRGFRLEHPVEVRVGLRGLMSLQALPPLRIAAAGLAHEQTLPLRFVPTTPNPTLEVRSTLSDVDVALDALPRVDVRPEATSMMGLGLERMDVRIRRVTPHGALLPPETPVPVAITLAGGGRVEPGRHRLAAGESELTFGLRSSGWRPLRIVAAAGNLSGGAVIEQRLPWIPVAFALAGGALGGYARRFVRGARGSLTGRRMVEGVVVAVVAYVAAVLGVGYLGLPAAVAATEAGAFLTAALTGFVGVNVLEVLARPGAGRGA